MLLLHRHQNESIVIYKDGEPQQAIVVRVCEVLPTGGVALGFIGDGYTVVRQEIFSKENAHKRRGKEYGRKFSGYYS